MSLDPSKISLRNQKFYADAGINFMLGKTANQIDPAQQVVSFSDNEELHYDKLLLATGDIVMS